MENFKLTTIIVFLLIATTAISPLGVNAVIVDSGEGRPQVESQETVDRKGPISRFGVSPRALSTKTCPDDSRLISLQLLQVLVADRGVPAVQITSNVKSKEMPKKIKLVIPSYLSGCTSFKFTPIFPDERDAKKTIVLSVSNEFPFDSVLKGQNLAESDGTIIHLDENEINKMTVNEKYEACLRLEGLAEKTEKGLKLKWPDDSNAYSKETSKEWDLPFMNSSNFTQLVKVVFGSPKRSSGYLPLYQEDTVTNFSLNCFRYEELDKDGIFLISAEESKKQRLVNLCEKGTLEEIKRELSNPGNAPDILNILDKAYEREIEEFAKKKYRELESLGEQIKESDDDDEIRSLGRRYIKILDELKIFAIDPSKERLKNLLSKRIETDSSEEREKIDNKIKKLNDFVGEYANHNRIYNSGAVLDKLLEFGHKDYANKVAEFKLNSLYFASVYKGKSEGRREKVSFSTAEKKVKKDIKQFKARSLDAEQTYYAKTGEAKFSPALKKKIDSARKSRDNQWKRDMKKISTYQQYCQKTMFGFVQNPAGCQYGMMNQNLWYRQALSKRSSYNKSIGRYSSKYERYLGYETEARELASSDSGEDLYDDQNFLGSYGIFDSPTSGNTASMYSMTGGMGGSPMMTGGMGGSSMMMGGMSGSPMMMGGMSGSPMMMGGMSGSPMMMGGGYFGSNPYMMNNMGNPYLRY